MKTLVSNPIATKTFVASFAFLLLLQIPALSFSVNGRIAPRYTVNAAVVEVEQALDKLVENFKSRSRFVSLQQAIELALLNNPRLAIKYTTIQQSEWNLIAVRRSWYPDLEFSNKNLYNFFSNNPPLNIKNTTIITPSIKLNWTFFDPSRAPNTNSSSEILRANQLLFNVEARDIVLQTQLAFFNLQEQQQLIKNYQGILNSTTEQVTVTVANFNAGTADISQVEQIRTQQLKTLNLLISSYKNLAQASAELAALITAPIGTMSLAAGELTLVGEWKESQAETIAQAERMREEIQASLAIASSFRWSATAIYNSYLPTLNATAAGNYESKSTKYEYRYIRPVQSIERGGILDETNWDNRILLGFTWKVFDGGVKAAQAQAKQYSAQEYVDKAASQQLTVAKEVEIAYANYIAAKLALQTTRELVKSASNALIAVRARFNNGFSDMTSVVQAITQSIDASREQAKATKEYNDAVALLYRYSAQWPDGALTALNQRVKVLK
jgi:outer membrane protein TolC